MLVRKNGINRIIAIAEELCKGDSDSNKRLLDEIKAFSPTVSSGNWYKTVLDEVANFLEAEGSLKNTKPIGLAVELLKDVKANHSQKGYLMYKHPAWKALLEYRSPFDTMHLRKCGNCGFEYGHAVVGDFAEIASFNCTQCKNMFVGSLQAVGHDLKCKNGAALVFDKCPNCLSDKIDHESRISPYVYFRKRTFFRRVDDCKG